MSNKVYTESEWERSAFAMTSEELDVHEAVGALSRLLRNPSLPAATLEIVRQALECLRMKHGGAT